MRCPSSIFTNIHTSITGHEAQLHESAIQLELCQIARTPSEAAVSVNGLTLTPESATDYIDLCHTVTAKVTDELAELILGLKIERLINTLLHV